MLSITQSMIRPAIRLSKRTVLVNPVMRRVYLSTLQEDINQAYAFAHQHDDHHHQVAPLTNTTIYAAADEDVLQNDISAPFHPTVNAVFDE